MSESSQAIPPDGRAATGDRDRLAEAEESVAALAAEYPNWVGQEIARARDVLGDRAGNLSPDETGRLFGVVHDIKGQGGSFGYPLISEIAGMLCGLLRADPVAEPRRDVCLAHLEALSLVAEHRIAGTGGAAGQALVTRLRDLSSSP